MCNIGNKIKDEELLNFLKFSYFGRFKYFNRGSK